MDNKYNVGDVVMDTDGDSVEIVARTDGHTDYHYHENFYTLFFKGRPAELTQYEIIVILPEGSTPGKWGLTHMTLSDKVNNKETYEFTEIIHFELE